MSSLKVMANEDTLLRKHCCSWHFLTCDNWETFVADTKCFWTKSEIFFCVPDIKFVSAKSVVRMGKWGKNCVGNNVSATMCPHLSGLLIFSHRECYLLQLRYIENSWHKFFYNNKRKPKLKACPTFWNIYFFSFCYSSTTQCMTVCRLAKGLGMFKLLLLMSTKKKLDHMTKCKSDFPILAQSPQSSVCVNFISCLFCNTIHYTSLEDVKSQI